MKSLLKHLSRLAILTFFLLLFYILYIIRTDAINRVSTPSPSVQTPKLGVSTIDISKHNKITDCWISYQGHIYDITAYFGSHPGGNSAMAAYCGGDGTKGFDTKDQGSSHSQTAHDILRQFLIQ